MSRNPHFDQLAAALGRAGWITDTIEDTEAFQLAWTDYGREKLRELGMAIQDLHDEQLTPEAVSILRAFAVLESRKGGESE